MALEKIISFRDKYLECKKNGNLVEIDISALKLKTIPPALCGVSNFMDAEKILVCLKNKMACSSDVCSAERGINK